MFFLQIISSTYLYLGIYRSLIEGIELSAIVPGACPGAI
jgi:hypothetical protein